MTIQRYRPKLAGEGRNKRAVMTTDTHGVYVTHASHQEEMDRLKRELDALKDGLKRQIFAPLEKAMMNALIKTAMQATQTVYTVNPCDKLTSERVREIMDAQIGCGVIQISEELSNAESGFMTRHVLAMPEPKVLLCIKSEATSFVAGNRYEYEMKDGALFVAQDEFVSDLHEEDFWHVTDGGAYYIVETVAGNAYFKK